MPPSTAEPSAKTNLESSWDENLGCRPLATDWSRQRHARPKVRAPSVIWISPMLSGRRRRPAVGAAVALACSVWLCGVTSHAQSTSDDLARRHFDSGVAYLEESDYDNALKAFQKAYELSKRPEILLNIATVHERQGALPSAVAALKGYLEASPQGQHVETVKLRIQNL